MNIEDVCKAFGIEDIEDFSDGYHTFESLYHQRMILFAALVDVYREKAWKSRKHSDGEDCFGGDWFIVGIDTPNGSYTYHYKNQYWDLFNCRELNCGKAWDGHTDKDVERLLSLERENGWISVKDRLPEEDQDVLFTVDFGEKTNTKREVVGGKYWFHHFCGYDRQSIPEGWYSNERIAYWMPLPEPPTNKQE